MQEAESVAATVEANDAADEIKTESVVPQTTTTTEASSATQTFEPEVKAEGIDRGVFYFGMGLGLGAANLADDAIMGNASELLMLRTGAILFDRLLVGGEVVLLNQYNTYSPKQHVGSGMSTLLGQVSYFPMADLPLNVSAGLGWSSALKIGRLADTKKGHPSITASSDNGGVAWQTAVGWDFFPGRGTNLGLQLRNDGAKFSNYGTVNGFALGL